MAKAKPKPKEKTKWKWSEMAEWQALQDKKEIEAAQPEPNRSGTCLQCSHGSFTLKIHNSRMDRVCKQCGDIVEDI